MGIMQEKKTLALGITTALRGAGGGGGSSQRQPIESPDSLRSIAYARIVDLISEGEIVGFADQANPLSCVFLNETPVANADGSLNFRNIQVDSRVGTQTQDPLPNFDGVENEIAIGVELRQGTPWVRSITNLNLDSIRVRLSTPALSKTNTSNGDITGHTVQYRIELQTDGGTFDQKLIGSFSGKTSSKYERTHRIELPPAETGWVVRVVRVTANDESAAVQDDTYIESYAEIIEAKLRMPMSALVSVIVDAEQFNNIPSRAYRIKGRIIRVPSNYNPDTRTYTGVWDGTFQSRYSNNPAWVFYDMGMNDRYGLGDKIPAALMDKWTLYRIGQYCDELVDDGFGGQEPRFTCNLTIQSQGDALKVMQDLATVFRGAIYATGGSITAIGDMPEDPAYTYTPANVVDGKFVYSGSDRKVRHTVALVSWSDLSDFGRAKVEYVEDEDGIARYGIQPTEITAIGCTSRGQARRWGRYLLVTERLETDSVAFSVGLDGTIVAPGTVVNIADPLRAGERRGGRIREATSTTVTVDLMAVSAMPGDTLVVTLPSGVSERRTIASIAGTLVEVTTPFSAIPVVQSVWAVDSVDIPLEQYRILGVAEDKGERLGFVLHGIKHVNAKFAYADTGVLINTPPVPPVPSGAVPPPTGLTVTHRDVADQNTTGKMVNVSWDAVSVANSYNLLWRQSNGQWVDMGTTGFTNIDIAGILPGGFEVQVMAINAFGVRSVPTFGGPYDIPAVGTPPGYVEEINNDIAQEIIDRFNADAEVAANAAADATAKANAALVAAQAYTDVIGAQLNDIIEADVWSAATNYVIGDIVQWDGKLYRAETDNINQQPDTNPDDWLLMGNYTSLGEAVAASISMSTQNASDIEAMSTSLDAVVARMPTGTGGLATQASVADEATARADADSALGSRITVVEARMPGGSGTLATASALSALDARVVTAENTITSQGNALTAIQARLPVGTDQLATANSVSLLESRVTTVEGEVDANSAAITSLDVKLSGSVGGNRLANPSFANNSTAYWTASSHALTPTLSPRLGGIHLAMAPGSGLRSINTIFSSQAAAGVEMSASPGEVSTFAVTVNIDAAYQLVIQYFNAAGTQLVNNTSPSYPSTAGDWVRKSFTAPAAPANTAYAVVAVFASNTTAHFRIFQPKFQLGAVATPFSEENLILGNATAVNSLDARVTTAEGTLTSQATALTAVKAQLGGGANLVPNASMEVDINGWTKSNGNAGAGFTMVFSDGHAMGTGDTNYYMPRGINGVQLNIAGALASGNWGQATCSFMPVVPGASYIGSAYVNVYRCIARFMIAWYTSAGVWITETLVDQAATSLTGPTLAQTPRKQLKATAPSNAAYAAISLRMVGTGESNPYIWWFRPMFEEATADKTQASAWEPSGLGIDNKYASVTQSLSASVTTAQNGVNTLNARYTLALNVNGYVSGIRSENTGTTSTFDILADTVRILSPAGGARIEMSSSNIRVYDGAGVMRVRMGVW